MALDTTQPRLPTPEGRSAELSPVADALAVFVEPLVADARVAVLGALAHDLHARLLAMGARTIHLFVANPEADRLARLADEVPRGVSVRPFRDDFDVRDGAFDLVVIPDVGRLPDPGTAIGRIRRVLDPRGSVVALGRASTGAMDPAQFPDLAPAAVEYAELYDLFALDFESVTMTGVLPFTGIVFAELGAGDDLAVSVDTRLVDAPSPGVFVVVAGSARSVLDPYAIVQVTHAVPLPAVDTAQAQKESRVHDAHEMTAAFAAVQVRGEILAAQLDEHRERLAAAGRAEADQEGRFAQVSREREAAVARASELEVLLAEARQSALPLERRLLAAEEGMLERDDHIARLNAERDARSSEANELRGRDAEISENAKEIVERAERAESSLALHLDELGELSERHAHETHELEEELQKGARAMRKLEVELARREEMVRELVASLEEAREREVGADDAGGFRFEEAPPSPPSGGTTEERLRLHERLDELAWEVARREGELVARAWRITELEEEKARLARAAHVPSCDTRVSEVPGEAMPLDRAQTADHEELSALRQALAQEHAARIALESGEELSLARMELARHVALVQQLSAIGTRTVAEETADPEG